MIDQENTGNPGQEAEDFADLEQETEGTEEVGFRKKKEAKNAEKGHEHEAEVAELKDKYLRLYAEFDNYKKRTVREKLDMMRTAAQDTLASLLTILDDFDRARKTEDFSDGIELLYQKLYGTLKNMGLQEMDSTGKEFNPELHEAVTEIPAPSEEMKGKIIDTVEKGYYLSDKIIRHAKVVVGR